MSKRTTPSSKTTADAPKAPRAPRKATTTEVTAAGDLTSSATSPQPSHDEIAIRAYFIAIEQGTDPVAAWLLAERELTTA